MACPYFSPTKPLAKQKPPGTLRPPLGELYAGRCRCRDNETFAPAEDLLEEGCNFGYARTTCARFPDGDGPDAVRFSLAEDDGSNVRILYAIERDHLPFGHGLAVYARERGEWTGVDGLLQSQAAAYLNSYLRWKEIENEAEGSQGERV